MAATGELHHAIKIAVLVIVAGAINKYLIRSFWPYTAALKPR